MFKFPTGAHIILMNTCCDNQKKNRKQIIVNLQIEYEN